MRVLWALSGMLLLAVAEAAAAHPNPQAATPVARAQPAAPAGAVQVVDAFHAALARGDTGEAAKWLDEAVIVYEAGGAERSRAEYAARHLAGDAEFAQAVGRALVRRAGGGVGDMAWVASEGRTTGRFKDRDVDRVTTETMVLRRRGGIWRIVHVHWSSRAAAAAH